MHRAFCIFLVVAVSPTAWTETKWSKEIPAPESGSSLTRARRQFNFGDWIPLSQPCVTCRPLTDPADAGRRHEEIGLTPPRPPTVTRQIHKSTFFPQDESSILSVPPPPVFSRNQISNTNTRFPNFLQSFNSPNALQFDTQSVFPQAQFLSQPFLGSTSLLGSNYPQVLPLLNNPSALLVHGNLGPAQEVKTQKINHEAKAPNLQENVILEQNRQQQQHQVKNQQVNGQVAGLQVPVNTPPVDFVANRQQQSILEGNILTPPPVPNNTFPDVIIPGLDKEEIQLLYVPLETLKQRTHHHHQQQQQQQQRQQIQQNQVQQQQRHQVQQNQAQQQHIQLQQQQHIQIQQQQNQQQNQVRLQPQVQIQQVQNQAHLQPQLQVQQQQINFQQQHHQQRVTPSPQAIKFTQSQQTVRPVEHPTTPQPAGHFITHSATPSPHTVGTTFQQVPVTPSTLFFQHQPFQQSQAPVASPTPETPTLQTFLTPSPLTQKFSPFPSVTPVDNLVTAPEGLQFTQEFLTTPKTIVEQLPVKDAFGKDIFEDVKHVNKFKSISIQQQEEQQKQLLLEQQKEEEKQKLLRQEQEQKLLLEQQQRERAHQEKLIREQQERERQQKLQRERQEQERKQKLIREQQEKERQQKLLLEQQERERQHKILLEQQERERQHKLLLEQQERERQQKIIREQQERERQQKILREQQERERQQKLYREQQERERQQKLIREQQERERQQKLLLEQQEKERQEAIFREQQERERQQLLYEQQERERQERILLEERRQKELLIKQQQEREQQQQQILLQEQQEREKQLLLNQQQQYLIQQQQLGQPLPTQFDLQPQGEPTRPPQFEIQTEVPDELVPHQPPLSVFYGSNKGQPRITDVLKELRGAKTISVLDQYLEDIPKVFVGPANLTPPKGYGKFELPYLSNIDVNRVERKVERLPFFVAPLNFVPPAGYSKIPFPAPHVGSVVVSSEAALRQAEKGSTASPYLSTLRSTLTSRLRQTTQAPPTTHIQQILPKHKVKETRLPNALLPEPEQVNELRTETIITTTVIPETTTQARGRRPYYRTKARRPATAAALQGTRRPETVDNTQFQKTETVERKPNVKFPKRRQRVKTTTENPEYDSVNSANRQFLVETSPTPATQRLYGNEEFGNEFVQQEYGRTEVQGLFEVDTNQGSKVEQPSTERVGNTDYQVPTQAPVSTVGFQVDNGGFSVTTQRPSLSTGFDATQKPPTTIDYDRFGQTNYFVTTQRIPAGVEVENAGFTGFYEQTPRIPVGIESNGDSGFYNKQTFTSTGGDNTFFTASQDVEKDVTGFGKYENIYFQEGGKVITGSSDKFFDQQQETGKEKVEEVTKKQQEEEVRSTPKSIVYETTYQTTEFPTETPKRVELQTQNHEVNVQYVESQKEEEDIPQTTTQASRVKTRFRTKSRGQVNFATSQTSTQSPYVRKRIVYKTRKEEPYVNGTDEVRTVTRYRGQRKGYQTSTESAYDYEGAKTVYTVKPQRRTSASAVYRRRKPVTSTPETTSQNYPPNFEVEYSPSGVSNDVFEDQIRESSLSRNQYAENAVTYTATTTTTTTPASVTEELLYTRRRDDAREEYVVQKTEETPTENYPANFRPDVYVSDISRVTPSTRGSTAFTWSEADEDLKKFQESKKAFDPSLEKKNARRRIRVRVHKRPHEQIETAESQNFGTVANALVPPTPAKPSVEPDLYRFSKTGFNFDQSDKFAGTKNQAYVRNITSDILENTATFSAPGVESETDVKKVTIVTEEKAPAVTTTEFVPETTESIEADEAKIENDSKENFREEAETTTEAIPVETTTYFTTAEDAETETEELVTTTPTTTTSTTTTTTTTTTPPPPQPITTTTTTPEPPTTVEEDASKEIQLSTATEISHETEICFRGKCIKTNSATADDDLRRLVQSADKILIT
ncbi:UNVERIFIED_CONTAM: hypothetical protein PYX00_000159 [Menopon gallinae]|uniref:Uncharacterized protein n=1 Tax=Menopon gallinae TaxID=328185 RepID=A0AAW2I7W2_9NEOP